jgi:hypothetical protein
MSCKSASFYIKEKNLDYIADQIKDKDRYNKSNWLDDLIDHLRSKSKPVITKEKKPVKRFVKPSLQEVSDHMASSTTNGSQLEAEKFFDYYASNGWKVGKNSMKDWKPAVNNWLRGKKTNSNHSATTTRNIENIQEWLDE